VRINLDNPKRPQELITQISSLPFIKGIRQEQNSIYVNTHDAKRDFRTLNQLMLDKEIPYSSIGVATPSLDEIFLSLTQKNKGVVHNANL
ncbi:hypothetical protein DFR58_1851, partial [Anaerobacterium chartisolvens]